MIVAGEFFLGYTFEVSDLKQNQKDIDSHTHKLRKDKNCLCIPKFLLQAKQR